MREPLVWLGVGVLGGLGGLARVLLSGRISRTRLGGGPFPSGTLVVNVSGSLLLGLLTGIALHGDALLLAGGAVLGSYTTFSTWSLECHRLAQDGHGRALAANVLGSLGLGLAAVALGRLIGGAL